MLMEQILSRENLHSALKRVECNKGSYGADEMPVQNLRKRIMGHWESMEMGLLQGTYEPQPVRRVEIPKPDGVCFYRHSNRDRSFHLIGNCPSFNDFVSLDLFRPQLWVSTYSKCSRRSEESKRVYTRRESLGYRYRLGENLR